MSDVGRVIIRAPQAPSCPASNTLCWGQPALQCTHKYKVTKVQSTKYQKYQICTLCPASNTLCWGQLALLLHTQVQSDQSTKSTKNVHFIALHIKAQHCTVLQIHLHRVNCAELQLTYIYYLVVVNLIRRAKASLALALIYNLCTAMHGNARHPLLVIC